MRSVRFETALLVGRALRPAFTIHEVSAILACLGVLGAIVAPSLSVALGKSRLAGCTDRLRAIGQAGLTYSAADVAESAIPVHRLQFQPDPYHPLLVGPYEWGGKSGIGSPDYYSQYPGLLGSRYGTAAGIGPATRPLNNVLYPHGFRDNLYPSFNRNGATIDTQLALDAYRCPADDGPPLAAHCPD